MAEREDDQSLFERIWYAERDGRILIGIDLRHYNRPGSPTYVQKENVLPILAALCCSASAWILGGWVWGLGILASGIIFTLTTANFWIMHRLRQRTLALALSGRDAWDRLWGYGGITLRLPQDGTDTETAREANAPGDDWRRFARLYLPEQEPG